MLTRRERTPLRKLMLLGAMAGAGALVEDTATGNPLKFVTDVSKPLKSLLIPFTPQQDGTGDPSLENIRSILPWNGLTVFGGGKNLLNPVAENLIPFEDTSYNRYTLVNGQIITTGNALVGFLVEVKEQTRYSYSFASEENAILEVFSYSAKPDKIRNADTQIAYSTTKKGSFTTPQGCKYVACAIVSTVSANVISDFQLEAGQTATAYEPYKPITDTDIVFPSTVYGGTLDVVSGVLTVTHVLWTNNTTDMNNESDFPGWNNAGIRDIVGIGKNEKIYTALNIGGMLAVNTNNANDIVYMPKSEYSMTQDEWKALALDIQIAMPLATPQEITLTPEQITALVGDNTIWSDADGSMTAMYLKKG